MVTYKVYVGNDDKSRDKAMELVDSFAAGCDLSQKDKMHITLLTEELLGMTAAIGGTFSANFWIEGNEKSCRLCLSAQMNMSLQKREELLKASTSGKNDAYRGIMDKVREEMELYMLRLTESAEDSTGVDYGLYSPAGIADDWTLSDYKGSLQRKKDEARIAEWDTFERSIVANIADDVSVGIRGDKVEVTITKSFA